MNQELQGYIEYVGKHEQNLSPYAIKSLDAVWIDGETTRDFYERLFAGRDTFKKNRYRWRTPFQLDRDSILYSSLFTRLSKKTQLYTGQGRVENRMTHTLKVAQITRSICRSLFLNEDLGEAIAFGHDVGHTPFAHEGERALNEWLREKLKPDHGQMELDDILILNKVSKGYQNSFKTYATYSNDSSDDFFSHGRQSVRLLTYVRKKIPDRYFTKNTLFGIWRHSTKAFDTDEKFSYKQQIDENTTFELGKDDASLEAQVVRLADDIAWIISDLTESIRSKILNLNVIREAFEKKTAITVTKDVEFREYLQREDQVSLYTYFITDLINQSKKNLEEVKSSENIKKWEKYISFSIELEAIVGCLKNIIEEYVISAKGIYRGDKINYERLMALCELYFDKPNDFLSDIEIANRDLNFPFKNEWYKKGIRDDKMVRALAIIDFASVLTDMEVARLSESVPQEFRI